MHLLQHAGLILVSVLGLGETPDVCERAKLRSPDADFADRIGFSVDLSGDVAIAGAPFDDDLGGNSGGAAVFRLTPTGFVFETTLLAGDGDGGDFFGVAVAIDGDTAVVGASLDEIGGPSTGSAYVFRYDGVAWSQEARLNGDPLSGDEEFGSAVAIDGDVIVIGAGRADAGFAGEAGAAYVFRRDGTTWTQEARLIAEDALGADQLGRAVAVDGNTVVAGAPFRDEADLNTGAAYLFTFDGATWAQQQKLFDPEGDLGDRYGTSVAIDGAVVAVGAPIDDDVATPGGSCFVYRRLGEAWILDARLADPAGTSGDGFGTSVAIEGDRLIAGAPGADGGATNGGGVLAFGYNPITTTWAPTARLVPADIAGGDQFGQAVAIDVGRAYVGMPRDDDDGPESGSTFLFSRVEPADCNGNDVDDACDVLAGTSPDENGNGRPDECDIIGDVDGDGFVDNSDLDVVILFWDTPCEAPPNTCAPDVTEDGVIDVDDLLELLNNWNPMGPPPRTTTGPQT